MFLSYLVLFLLKTLPGAAARPTRSPWVGPLSQEAGRPRGREGRTAGGVPQIVSRPCGISRGPFRARYDTFCGFSSDASGAAV